MGLSAYAVQTGVEHDAARWNKSFGGFKSLKKDISGLRTSSHLTHHRHDVRRSSHLGGTPVSQNGDLANVHHRVCTAPEMAKSERKDITTFQVAQEFLVFISNFPRKIASRGTRSLTSSLPSVCLCSLAYVQPHKHQSCNASPFLCRSFVGHDDGGLKGDRSSVRIRIRPSSYDGVSRKEEVGGFCGVME